MAESIETLDIDFLGPEAVEVDVVGGSIEGGRNQVGFATTADISGGGIVVCKYTGLFPGNVDPAKLRYLSRLGALLNGSVGVINVPLILEYISPLDGSFVGIDEMYDTVPHDDDSPFDDDSEYSQPVIVASVTEAADIGAGVIKIKMIAGADLQGGEWFSINHPTAGHRAYRIRKIVSVDAVNRIFEVAIRPTLREAIVGTEDLNFVRPLCQMMLRPGTTIPLKIKSWWIGSADIDLMEAAPPNGGV